MSSSGSSARCSLPDFLIVSRSIEEIDRWKRQIESLKQGRPGCLLVITAAHEGVDRKNAARLRRHAGYPESAHPKQMNRQTNYLYIWMLDSHLDARRHSIGSTRCRAAPCELSACPSPFRSRQWARNLSCDRRRHASASSGERRARIAPWAPRYQSASRHRSVPRRWTAPRCWLPASAEPHQFAAGAVRRIFEKATRHAAAAPSVAAQQNISERKARLRARSGPRLAPMKRTSPLIAIPLAL